MNKAKMRIHRGISSTAGTAVRRKCHPRPAPVEPASRSSTSTNPKPILTTTLVTTAAAGMATAGSFLTTPVADSDLTPKEKPTSTDPPPPYASSPLLRDVSRADPAAVQSLLLLLADHTQHTQLLHSGVLPAVLDGIRAAGHEHSAIRLGLVRAFADISEASTSDIQHLISPALVDTLTDLLSSAAEQVEESWLEWLSRQVGVQSNAPSSTSDLLAGEAYHVARVVAGLTRHAALHEPLLENTRFLPVLCRALHGYADSRLILPEHTGARQYLLASVSALAKSASRKLVDASVHKLLLRFACDTNEKQLQMYAIAGIRNMARHPSDEERNKWQVHRELVVEGLPNALTHALASSNAQTRAFAAGTFADVMTTGHHKASIIRDRLAPAYSPFAKLLTDRDPVASRSFLRAIHTLCGASTGVNTPDALSSSHFFSSGLSSSIVEHCGPFVNGVLARGDMSGIRATRAMCKCEEIAKGLVEKGLLEVLLKSVEKASGEFREESIYTLAALVQWPELSILASQRGALRAILKRPCLENNAKSSTMFLARMARDPDNRVEIAHSGMPVLLAALTARQDPEACLEATRALHNLSLDGVAKVMVSLRGGLAPLIKLAAGEHSETRRIAVAILAELSEAPELAVKIVEANALSNLLASADMDSSLNRDIARIIAQLSQMHEVHGSLASSGVADWVSELVKRNGGKGQDAVEVMHYATLAVCNISFTEGTARNAIRDSGVSRTFSVIVASGMGAPLVVHGAKQAMRNLRGEEGVSMLPAEKFSKPPGPL